MGVGGQRHTPVALPPGKTWYPLYRKLGGPQDLPGQVRKEMAHTSNIKIGKYFLTTADGFFVQYITKRLLWWQLFISFIQEGQYVQNSKFSLAQSK
jgi:hypothetical protein